MTAPTLSNVLGIPWYPLEHFAELKAMMVDGHNLAATHAEWQTAAERTEHKFSREGRFVVRALLIPNEFREYCLRHSLNIDAKGRSHFAAAIAREVAMKAQGGLAH
jgi:hypothetical protein